MRRSTPAPRGGPASTILIGALLLLSCSSADDGLGTAKSVPSRVAADAEPGAETSTATATATSTTAASTTTSTGSSLVEAPTDPASTPGLAPADAVDTGATPLAGAFSPLAPGTYQTRNLGVALDVDIPDGWAVQPNFLGFVVLTDVGSFGPYFSDIRMQSVMQSLAPADAAGQPTGPGMPLDAIDALLDRPPPNLSVTNVDRDAEFAGLPATRFDAAIENADDCDDAAPCVYALVGPVSEPTLIVDGFRHRIWVVPDVIDGGALTLAVAAPVDEADDWFARADDVIASFRLSDDS